MKIILSTVMPMFCCFGKTYFKLNLICSLYLPYEIKYVEILGKVHGVNQLYKKAIRCN